MQILVHTDNHIHSDERLQEYAQTVTTDALARFGDRITRVEIHLADENGSKEGGPFRCAIEMRLAGLSPLGVTHSDAHVKDALSGALEKAVKVLGNQVDREHNRHPG